MNTKKAQIKMFESMAVLVVFFFMIVFGITFYFKLQETSLQREFLRNTQLQSIQIAQKSMFLPELDCSFVGVQKENCFDYEKIRQFAKMLEQGQSGTEQARLYYFDVFGYSNITVYKVYPSSEKIMLYSKPSNKESRKVTQVPLLILDSKTNTYSFGYLEVMVFEQ